MSARLPKAAASVPVSGEAGPGWGMAALTARVLAAGRPAAAHSRSRGGFLSGPGHVAQRRQAPAVLRRADLAVGEVHGEDLLGVLPIGGTCAASVNESHHVPPHLRLLALPDDGVCI